MGSLLRVKIKQAELHDSHKVNARHDLLSGAKKRAIREKSPINGCGRQVVVYNSPALWP
jgi:hypothetical protein